ncbi:hypothetical protein G4V62_10470 [Bacillaceae bacterium SIJ1]|uniref:hypothetical protein n=1 Tax=Litoribacterium kuwaitense TaxID=1398745 RepID=UPI0013EC6E5A|nr:hypothetical protein [Litoribacterium kuwaitense]NGP45356.1 hypothetical protein [Litoribacterium kuwaitense]
MKRLFVIFAILFIIFLPRIIWMVKEETPLDIFVVDKTVPKTDYREHNGLFMILENKKIIHDSGSFRGQNYDLGRDYFGYDPYDQEESHKLPESNLDLIYITDTYGVYQNDLEEKPDGQRSSYIYGGVDLTEWNMIIGHKAENTTLIAEFNSFATPTEEVTSDIMQKNLGVQWNGWTGRYFIDLSSDEVPPWLIANYEKQYDDNWTFAGEGIAFVHTSDRVVVLNDKEHDGKVTFEFNEKGQEKFPKAEDSYYMYWFDIVQPNEGSAILANYSLNISEKGKALLKENSIPSTFPAIVYQEHENTYYFAGDYADYPNKALTKWAGLNDVLKFFANGYNQFYWWTYVPMMNEIIDTIVKEKKDEQIG